MDRRDFLKSCLAVTAGCAAANSGYASSLFKNSKVEVNLKTVDSNITNILLFLTDDQRYSLVNAFEIEDVITPAMDSIAANGIAFRNTYIMPTSHAPCRPSRAMLLTGTDAFQLVDDGKVIPTSQKMIQETLQQAGYTTFITGKWHNEIANARGFSVGNNVFFGGMSGQYSTSVRNLRPDGTWSSSTTISGIHSSELFSDTAIAFLESQRYQAKPFFAYIPYKAPHDPRACPQEYMDMYNLPDGNPDPEKVKLPVNFARYHPYAMNEPTAEDGYFDNGFLSNRDENLASHPRDPQEVLTHIRDYYAITTHLDAQIGRVLDKLRDIGQADNTIIIFAGDNGLAVGQHALMGKQNLYQHSASVPLIISGKDIPKAKSVLSLCYLFDVYPTICDLLKLPIPSSVTGRSLAPMLKDQSHTVRQSVYLPFQQLHRAVRMERYKLIEYNVSGTRTTQLFDIIEDPWEVNNLAGDPQYAQVLDQLRAELIRLKNEFSDDGAFWDGF